MRDRKLFSLLFILISHQWWLITTIAICQCYCWLLIVRSRRSQLTLSVSLLLSCLPPNCWNNPVLGILGVPKMALRVFESKFWDHFSRQTSPQKDTLWSQIGPQKVIFGHFAFFVCYFYFIFPWAWAKGLQTFFRVGNDFFGKSIPKGSKNCYIFFVTRSLWPSQLVNFWFYSPTQRITFLGEIIIFGDKFIKLLWVN